MTGVFSVVFHLVTRPWLLLGLVITIAGGFEEKLGFSFAKINYLMLPNFY